MSISLIIRTTALLGLALTGLHCHLELTSPSLQLPDYTVEGTPFPGDSMRIRVVARNTSRGTIQFTHSGCPLTIRAYRSSSRSGTPDWDQSLRAGGCKLPTRGQTLARGDSIVWQQTIAATEVLRGNQIPPFNPLSPGTYYFDVMITHADPQIPVVLAAGAVSLGR
jgi:hypothetical protein